MKKDIEQIISENLQKFDAAELPEGFLSRFEQKINRPRRQKMIFGAIATAATAAVVALFFILQTPIPTRQMSEIEKEIATIREYYQGQQQKNIDIIEKLLKSAPIETQQEIRGQIAIMEAEDMAFQTQIDKALIKDERYLAHEVQYYRNRQNNLEHIQKILSR